MFDDYKERLMSEIVPSDYTGCWLWIGYSLLTGYGRMRVNGKMMSTHRLSYMIHRGKLPPRRPFVCHKCDTPACCNPDHLFASTPKGNMRDMIAKGRQNWEKFRNHSHFRRVRKLTDPNVDEIRGAPQYRGVVTDLAIKFDVTKACVSQIRKGTRKYAPKRPDSLATNATP